MPNTTENRRGVRIEALGEVLKAVRGIAPPPGKGPGWVTEFGRGVKAIARVLENQIAQAERRITVKPTAPRRKSPPPRRPL